MRVLLIPILSKLDNKNSKLEKKISRLCNKRQEKKKEIAQMHIVLACQETPSFPTLKDLKLIQTLHHTLELL